MKKRTTPQKRPDDKHAILVRLPVKQHRTLKAVADDDNRSVNNAVVVAIDEYIAQRRPRLSVVPDPEERPRCSICDQPRDKDYCQNARCANRGIVPDPGDEAA